MREVVMQNAEPDYTREATEILLQILDIIYENVDLEQVAYNSTQINAEERTQLLSIPGYFEGF